MFSDNSADIFYEKLNTVSLSERNCSYPASRGIWRAIYIMSFTIGLPLPAMQRLGKTIKLANKYKSKISSETSLPQIEKL